MKRRTLIKGIGAAALAAPGILSAAGAKRVVIVGAGATGLTAAYHLRRAGIDAQILEASSRWGGRVDRLSGFADFPIDMGAEWIHGDPGILGSIIGRDDDDLGVQTIKYRPETYQFWDDGRLRNRNLFRFGYSEVKFHTTTWYGFFERFVLPEIKDRIVLNARVNRITQSAGGVTVGLRDGRLFEADYVVVAVPVSILKRGDIRFEPGLPASVREGLRQIVFGNGFKAFLKFSERFYPDLLFEGPPSQVFADSSNTKIYYNAAFGKPTKDNVLGLFNVSEGSLPWAKLDDELLISKILSNLDEIYDGAASRHFQNARVRNWTSDPNILGSYSMSISGDRDPDEVLAPVGRIHFAGEALGQDEQATVQGAAYSAIRAVKKIARA